MWVCLFCLPRNDNSSNSQRIYLCMLLILFRPSSNEHAGLFFSSKYLVPCVPCQCDLDPPPQTQLYPWRIYYPTYLLYCVGSQPAGPRRRWPILLSSPTGCDHSGKHIKSRYERIDMWPCRHQTPPSLLGSLPSTTTYFAVVVVMYCVVRAPVCLLLRSAEQVDRTKR